MDGAMNSRLSAAACTLVTNFRPPPTHNLGILNLNNKHVSTFTLRALFLSVFDFNMSVCQYRRGRNTNKRHRPRGRPSRYDGFYSGKPAKRFPSPKKNARPKKQIEQLKGQNRVRKSFWFPNEKNNKKTVPGPGERSARDNNGSGNVEVSATVCNRRSKRTRTYYSGLSVIRQISN